MSCRPRWREMSCRPRWREMSCRPHWREMSCFLIWITAVAVLTAGVPAIYYDSTINGNAKGSHCVLPFMYKGHIYNTCVNLSHTSLWCSTTTNYDIDGQWGECLSQDPCLSHQTLSDPWRNIGFNSTSFAGWPMNDLKLQEGWYRFSGIGGDILDSTCSANRSGTNMTYSCMRSQSPNQMCQLLRSTSSGCSPTNQNLNYARCQGGFIIYYLFPTTEIFSTRHSSCNSSSCGEHAQCSRADGSCTCDSGLSVPDGVLPTGDSYGCTSVTTDTSSVTSTTTAITPAMTAVPNITVSKACRVWTHTENLSLQQAEVDIIAECYMNLSSKIDDITAQELSQNVVEQVLEVFIPTAHQKLSISTTNQDELVSSLNIMLNTTEKLASSLVKTTETSYSVSISLPDIEIRVFAVGPNNLLGKTTLINAADAQMEIDLIGMSKHEVNKGHAAVSFLSYTNITRVLNRSFISENNMVQTLMSTVVSATLPKTTNRTLTKPVNFTLKHNPEFSPEVEFRSDHNPSCMYWRETEWVLDGCTLIRTNNSHSVCSCVHLSTFALIMQTNPHTGDNSDRLLHLLNTVLVAVGLVFLSLALVTFALFRGNSRVTNLALINLCINLLLAHLLFLLTQHFLEDIRPKQFVCALLAGVLHFLFLSAFVWMFIDAVLLFITVKNLSKIRSKQREAHLGKLLMLTGYGSSLVVVGLSAGVMPNGYGSEICWLKMDRGFIWSFLGPVCFILASNVILFSLIIISIRVTLRRLDGDVSQIKQKRTIMFKTIAQSIILGCPWILGIFASSSKVVEILFLVLNSQQGTFIFLVYCVFNQEVRQQYRKLFGVLFIPTDNTLTEVQMT